MSGLRINTLTDAAATPWFDHPCFGGEAAVENADASFRIHYASMGDR
jgi:hypothetical protein